MRTAGVVFFVLLLAGGFLLPPPQAIAQTLSGEERARLEAQYAELQREIAEQERIIKETQAKKNTLQGNVTLLNAQIREAQAQIDAKNIVIKQLGAEIVKKSAVIGTLEERLARGKESLAAILRQRQVLEDASAVTVALGAESVSEFFRDIDAFNSIDLKLQELFAELEATKLETEREKRDLAAKQDATEDARFVIETKKQQVASNKQQTQLLLAITTNQETQYKKVLAERQAKAAAIRAALFPLRDASAISFGTALKYAEAAQAATGVEAALILAILTQESNLGANVGQCYLRNNSTGAGVGKRTGTAFARVMNPTRDVPPFLRLASDLGFDAHNQVVSCPIASAGGWGGAMGPAQFIPSTWSLYKERVARARGISVANPWEAQDAIMAMSMLLSDNGAAAGGYSAQHRAAAKYYAGGAWQSASGRSYANQVMTRVKNIQENIDFLANT